MVDDKSNKRVNIRMTQNESANVNAKAAWELWRSLSILEGKSAGKHSPLSGMLAHIQEMVF